jgi:hypothetical protein
MPEFVFMLTRDDVTISDARQVYEGVVDSGVSHVGCKDVGLDRDELSALIKDIRAAGHTSYLEVVAETDDANLRSARIAAEIEPDYLIGGTLVEPVQKILAGTGIHFLPYVGRVVGHPCLLRGQVTEIAKHAAQLEALGVDGVNLLAYRYGGDVPTLVRAVSAASSLPLLCAGSVATLGQVRELARLGVWRFTVGTAALDGRFVGGAPLAQQLEAILGAAHEGRLDESPDAGTAR